MIGKGKQPQDLSRIQGQGFKLYPTIEKMEFQSQCKQMLSTKMK